MTYLVTGCAGFIGYHVAERLLAAGRTVTGVDNLNDYYDPALKEARLARLTPRDGFTFHRLDLADAEGMKALFANTKPRVVINLAAQAGVRYSLKNPHAYVRSNLDGFLNVLEGCRHNAVKHLVYASSSSVYGASTRMPFSTHHNVDHPVSLYAASKKANELMAHTYSHMFGIPATGLRFFTVYGPWGRPDMAMFIFTKAMLAGEPIPLFADGAPRRDFTYIDDIVEGVIRVADRIPVGDPTWNSDAPDPQSSSAPYRLYNIGNHSPVVVRDLVGVLERALGVTAKIESLPLQPGDILATYADVDDLTRDVGFTPTTTIEEGVRKFVEWYREYYKV